MSPSLRRLLDFSILAIWVVAICVVPALWIRRLYTPQEFTLMEILLWSEDAPTSVSQIQKSFDWAISQWSGFSTAVLVATLGFLSAAVMEFLKGTLVAWRRQFMTLIILGVLSLLATYSFGHLQITVLNDEL